MPPQVSVGAFLVVLGTPLLWVKLGKMRNICKLIINLLAIIGLPTHTNLFQKSSPNVAPISKNIAIFVIAFKR